MIEILPEHVHKNIGEIQDHKLTNHVHIIKQTKLGNTYSNFLMMNTYLGEVTNDTNEHVHIYLFTHMLVEIYKITSFIYLIHTHLKLFQATIVPEPFSPQAWRRWVSRSLEVSARSWRSVWGFTIPGFSFSNSRVQ